MSGEFSPSPSTRSGPDLAPVVAQPQRRSTRDRDRNPNPAQSHARIAKVLERRGRDLGLAPKPPAHLARGSDRHCKASEFGAGRE